MQTQQIQQAIGRIEECADDAKDCLRAAKVPQALRDSVEALHTQAREGRTTQGEQALRQCALQLEETADRAMQLCRTAGQVDPQLQQAIRDAHQQASQLKHELIGQAV